MLRVLGAFEREGLEYVLIGAAAMGFPRRRIWTSSSGRRPTTSNG
jgi:hypothetical protein